MLRSIRPHNIFIENAIYMVTAVTSSRRRVFESKEHAAVAALSVISGVSLLHYWLFAFVVMPDHIHVVLRPREKSLPEGIGSLKGASAREVNRRNGSTGALWQHGYISRPIVSDGLFIREIEYVENNPVRAGLVNSPQEYPFSSASFRDVLDAYTSQEICF